MSDKKRIFISSVQKELEVERAAVAALISTNPFLLQHCEPVLFEHEPPPSHPARQPYLDCLRGCSIYVLLLANEYGPPDGELSATLHEYRQARQLKLPTIVFIKGMADAEKVWSAEVRAFIGETETHGCTYTRYYDREDLRPEMLRALLRTLKDDFGIAATPTEAAEGEHLIDAASTFESAVLSDVPVDSLDQDLVARFGRAIAPTTVEQAWRSNGEALHARGLAVRGEDGPVLQATAGAFVLFAHRPADRYPQCEILVDAYDETRVTGRPKGQLNVNAPLPLAVEQVLKFIDDHTFHPRRVVGLINVRLDEYPVPALREALVNAVAHRRYDDAARKILVRAFGDRIEIASPGYLARPLTLAKLRRGGCRPRSCNPLIAQTLATLGVMEQRGTGFARMRDAMLNHGLDEPIITQEDGFFVVIFPGPAGIYDRIRTPAGNAGPVTPAVEAQLNDRQKKMVAVLVAGEELTSRTCEAKFGVTRDTAVRDFALLSKLGLAIKHGKGRSVRYVQAPLP